MVITDYDLVPGGSFEDKLSAIYDRLREFCVATKTPLHMDHLTRNLISFNRDSDYPVGCLGLFELPFHPCFKPTCLNGIVKGSAL